MSSPPEDLAALNEQLLTFKKRMETEAIERNAADASVSSTCGQSNPQLCSPIEPWLFDLQEALKTIERLSSEIQRLKGGWDAQSSFRLWNTAPSTPQNPRPLAVESYRWYMLRRLCCMKLISAA